MFRQVSAGDRTRIIAVRQGVGHADPPVTAPQVPGSDLSTEGRDQVRDSDPDAAQPLVSLAAERARVVSLLLSLLYLSVTAAFGAGVLKRTAGRAFSPLELFAYGAPLGIVLGSFAVLLTSLVIGLTPTTVAIVGVASVAGTAALLVSDRRRSCREGSVRSHTSRWSIWSIAEATRCHVRIFPSMVLIGLSLLWITFYAGMTFYRDGALWASQIHVWSDLSVHLGQITAFADGENFPPQNPFYAGEPLAYHYLISLTAAALVELGLSPLSAIKVHDTILMILVTLAVFAFARRLTASASAAALAVLLFFLGSGVGWLLTAAQANRSGDIIGTLLDRAWNYGDVGAAGIRWEPMFLVAIAPTRGTLYGLALGVLCLAALARGIERRERRMFLLAGAVAGLLPLAHSGTLLALAMITPFLVLFFPSRAWLSFFGVWVALALPQLYLQGGLNGGAGRIGQDFGWMADDENAIWFWLTNLGLFLPLLAIAIFDRGSVSRTARRFLWAFMPIFVVANAVALDPTGPWNNLKVLLYWFLGGCILIAALLARAWQEQRSLLIRSLLAACVVSMVLSGLLMHLHVARGKNSYMVFSRAEIELAQQVRERTEPGAVFVSGLQHNPVVTALAGRPTLLFFTPYLVSWGIDPAQRERDVRAIYALAPGTAERLRAYDVSYVLVGPHEQQRFSVDVEAFRSRFPVVAATEGYQVFDVRGVTEDPVSEPVASVAGEPSYPARSEGECVASVTGGPPYYLEGGRRRLIPNDATRRSLGCDVVWPWGAPEIERIPMGDPLPPAR